eukprot:458082-Rhodomonas_salina.1
MLVPALRPLGGRTGGAGMLLYASYALPGTEIAYDATSFLRDVRACCYALRMRCPVLSSRMAQALGVEAAYGATPVLRAVRY